MRETGQVPRRFASTWHDDAVAAYEAYKFVVAFENADEPGYVTEKLALALLAGAVPVYWGPFDAAFRIFNRDAVIACDAGVDACARAVRATDANVTRFAELRAAPPLAPGGLDALAAAGLGAALAPLHAAFADRARTMS